MCQDLPKNMTNPNLSRQIKGYTLYNKAKIWIGQWSCFFGKSEDLGSWVNFRLFFWIL